MYIIIILIIILITFTVAYIKTRDNVVVGGDDNKLFYQQTYDNISAFAYVNAPDIDFKPVTVTISTPTPTLTPTMTPTLTPSLTPTMTPSQTPSPTMTPSQTPSPTMTPSQTPSPTVSPTPVDTPIATTGIPPSTDVMPTTSNPDADAAVVAINKFRATFNLPPMKYDTSKNADADACAAYDAQNGYHASMRAGKAPGSSAQCECNGIMGAGCVRLYENEQSLIQNPTSANPVCGSSKCGHWCIILGSFTSVASGTSGRFSTQNFYNGRPRCSFS